MKGLSARTRRPAVRSTAAMRTSLTSADPASVGSAQLANSTRRTDEVTMIRKLVGMLARRGYPEGLSYRVVREELRAAGHDAAQLDDVALD